MKLNFRLNAPQRLLPINNVLCLFPCPFLLFDFKPANAFLNHAVTFIDVRFAFHFGVRFTLYAFAFLLPFLGQMSRVRDKRNEKQMSKQNAHKEKYWQNQM